MTFRPPLRLPAPTPACVFAAATILAGPAAAQHAITHDYDVHGRLVRSTSAAGNVALQAYDAVDNRTSTSRSVLTTKAWEAESLPHATGFAEADGWAANVLQPAGHMTYGPYTPDVPPGARTAVWRILVDHVAGADDVAILDVFDATAGEVLATRTLKRNAWGQPWTYDHFELPFTMTAQRAGHAIEFRTWFIPSIHMRVDRIGYR